MSGAAPGLAGTGVRCNLGCAARRGAALWMGVTVVLPTGGTAADIFDFALARLAGDLALSAGRWCT